MRIYKVRTLNYRIETTINLLPEMNRDTDELPSIMAELEESVASIECTQ